MMNTTKYNYVHARLSPAESRALVVLARREGLNISAMMRLCIREACERRSMHAIGLAEILFSPSMTQKPDMEKVPE